MTDVDRLAVVRCTVRLAVACYALRVLADAADVTSLRTRRRLWAAGLAFYVAHVAAAFHFVYGWSHTRAWRETARQTAGVVGRESGVGLWANYAFTLLWLTDVVAWWVVGPDYPRRYRRTYFTVQAAFAFVAFNGTAVFGPEFWRPTTAAFGLVLAAGMVSRAKRRPTS